jgi:putative oxidoreductase
MKYIVLTGRIFFSLIFLMTIMGHFKSETANYAASQGVPFPNVLVPLSGLIAIAGGLCVALGFRAKMGAWLLVIFLVPVTVMMHAFWKETDAMQTQMQMTNFMKNLSLLGGALLIAYFGSGPLSLDTGRKQELQLQKNEVIKKPTLSQVLKEQKGIRPEDTKEKIKAELAEYDLHLDHFWQNAENPAEVSFLFTSGNLSYAKEFIKRQARTRSNLPQLIRFKEKWVFNKS